MANPCGPYWRCQALKTGISTWQGAHQVAQKLTSTTLPRKALRRKAWPARSWRVKSGAGLLSKFCVGDADCAAAAAMEAASKAARSTDAGVDTRTTVGLPPQ